MELTIKVRIEAREKQDYYLRDCMKYFYAKVFNEKLRNENDDLVITTTFYDGEKEILKTENGEKV